MDDERLHRFIVMGAVGGIVATICGYLIQLLG